MSRDQQPIHRNFERYGLGTPHEDLSGLRLSLDSWVHVETVRDERSLHPLKLINSGLELKYKRLSGCVEGDAETTRRLLMSAAKGVLGILKDTPASTAVVAYGLDYLSYLLRTEGQSALGLVSFAKNLQSIVDSRWLLFSDQDTDPGEYGSGQLCVLLSAWQAQLALFDLSERPKQNRLLQLSRLLERPNSDNIAPEFVPFQERLKDSLCLLADRTIRALATLVSPLRSDAQETAALRGFLGNWDEIGRRRAEMKSCVLHDFSAVLEIPASLCHLIQPFRIEALKSLDDNDIRALASPGVRAKDIKKAIPHEPYLKVAIALCAEVVARRMPDLVEVQKYELSSIPGRDRRITDATSMSEKLTSLLETPRMLPLLATTTQGIKQHITVCIPAPSE